MSIIIDLIRKKNEHHVFNFETIKALDKIESNNIYFLDKNSSSLDAIKNSSKINKISVQNGRFYFWVLSTFLLVKILLFNRKYNDKYILLSATPFHYYICTHLSKLLKININIFMHGELGYIKKSIGFGQRLGAYFLKKSFEENSGAKYIVINLHVYAEIKKLFSNIDFIYIPHPIQKISVSTFQKKDKMNFGTFGVQSKTKNSDKLYTLSKLFPNYFWNTSQFLTIGVTDTTFHYGKSNNVLHLCTGELQKDLIPQGIFFSAVSTLDFVLFFDNSNYDLIPSGVFSDCIAFNIPIVALTSNRLETYFNHYGNLGFLCSNIEDMKEIIMQLSINEISLSEIYKNIENVRADMSIEKFTSKLKKL